jgi:hypothetical protein
MGLVAAQVTFDRATMLPEDRVVNTWHFETPGPLAPTAADLDSIKASLTKFYLTPQGSAFSVSLFLSNFLLSPFTIKYYNLDVPPPRSPIRTDLVEWIRTVSGENFPAEVSLVLSYSGAQSLAVPDRSKRGRIYLGPLRLAAGEDALSDHRPTNTVRLAVTGAATALLRDGDFGPATWVWYSPTRRSRGLAPYYGTVQKGFVDNAFDTQRRRGRDPTQRFIFS